VCRLPQLEAVPFPQLSLDSEPQLVLQNYKSTQGVRFHLSNYYKPCETAFVAGFDDLVMAIPWSSDSVERNTPKLLTSSNVVGANLDNLL
jgi:hypothetical protein